MEKVNFGLFFGQLAAYLFVWVFSVTAHAAATAWMSHRFGDDTAKNAGRITFSPFVQASLIGTIVVPALAFFLSLFGGIPLIAWGKRVPVEVKNFRRPKLAFAIVTLTQTLTSAAIALISVTLLKILFVTNLAQAETFVSIVLERNAENGVSWFAPIEIILWYAVTINIALTVYSLIPFPPFAAGTAIFAQLPDKFKPAARFFNRYGIIFALLLLYFVFNYVLLPILSVVFAFLGI